MNLWIIQETNEKRVKNPRKYTGKNIVSEGFNVQLNDLHYELEEMEKKNNMLLVFIFFLVIIIIIQYSKNIDKLHDVLVDIVYSYIPKYVTMFLTKTNLHYVGFTA